ncbi:MAG TPA: DUF4403 family protein [Thermoanaerobaculia bacterium]
MRRRFACLTALLVLTGCAGSRVQTPPASPSAPLTGPGQASFFFPVEIPLAEVRRMLEGALPPRISDERRQEIADGIRDDFYRYTLDRGEIAVGFSGDFLTFEIPVRGRLTVGGRLRPVPLGKGLPVQETVDFRGTVRGTASLEIGPDWRPDPQPTVQVHLEQAQLRMLDVFSVSVRAFLEEKINPIVNRELQRASGEMLNGLALREKAAAVWKSLHVTRRAMDGENLWLHFEPTEISLVPMTGSGGALRTGLGISGRISMTLGQPAAPLAPAPLPLLELEAERPGGFEIEVPVAASAEELSRRVDQELRGDRFRIAGAKRLTVTKASLGVEGDRLRLTVDFQESSGTGRFVVHGRPVLDPATNVLSLDDLQYDLASGGRLLRLMDRFRRAEMLERLRKETRVDLTPFLEQAGKETAQAIRGLLPPGMQGEVRVEPVRILGVGVAEGAVWARCRLAGTTTGLRLSKDIKDPKDVKDLKDARVLVP